jgi:alkylation response protein AidB-like acyl-CoA dehydrogenase
MEVYGGYGYTVDAQVERDLRDALGTRISSGTPEMQRSVIAARLGLR